MADEYRVAEAGDEFQPEMFSHIKDGPQWVPLRSDGFWADPDSYSTGEITVASVMSREEAERAIWRAKLVNRRPL